MYLDINNVDEETVLGEALLGKCGKATCEVISPTRKVS